MSSLKVSSLIIQACISIPYWALCQNFIRFSPSSKPNSIATFDCPWLPAKKISPIKGTFVAYGHIFTTYIPLVLKTKKECSFFFSQKISSSNCLVLCVHMTSLQRFTFWFLCRKFPEALQYALQFILPYMTKFPIEGFGNKCILIPTL